ncbi:MAG: BspA family leucine-rich repeat surface protein, partial [Erysipelotrichaceae bacterium]|nr:BspA family leucine-rich repeat surface protein [Erysipelotrichaceae bacterium]
AFKTNGMFAYCRSLVDIDLSKFNAASAWDMIGMFQGCSSLTSLDLSSFTAKNAENMSFMFNGCSSLTSLDLSSFQIYKASRLNSMFSNCTSLEELILGDFKTSTVTTMESMFQNCSSLTALDLRSFDTSKVTNMSFMFNGCSNLTTIYSEAWNTETVANDTEMFLGCEKIVGKSEYAIQTPYDETKVTKEMATPNGGYFTVPDLVEWNATVHYIDDTEPQPIKIQTFIVTDKHPEITTEKLNEFMPDGYELVDDQTSFTVTENDQVFEAKIRKIQWNLTLEYQTADGTVIKEEQIQVTQLNPVVSAQTITEKVPTGYELVDPASDWTATSNGDKKIIQVRAIEWTVNLEYQTVDGDVIKEEQIQVIQLNPVVSAQTITEKVPTGYELVDAASDWTATSNGDKKIIQVRAIEWAVSLEYQTADGDVVKEEQIQVMQLNPVVTAQMITDGVPAGYELV